MTFTRPFKHKICPVRYAQALASICITHYQECTQCHVAFSSWLYTLKFWAFTGYLKPQPLGHSQEECIMRLGFLFYQGWAPSQAKQSPLAKMHMERFFLPSTLYLVLIGLRAVSIGIVQIWRCVHLFRVRILNTDVQ